MGWKKAIQSLRLRLRSGLRQRGGVFDAGLYLGLRPRLVYVGPLALGLVGSLTRVVFLGLRHSNEQVRSLGVPVRPRLVCVGPLALGVGVSCGLCEHVMG